MEKPFQAYRGDEPFTFVCYAHEDREVVYPEIGWLHERGINLWYDEGISAGRNWRAEIGDSLQAASRVLFYISPRSLASDHCNREINFALDEGKEIVPVYLEPVELTTDLKIGLNRVQALVRDVRPGVAYQQALLHALGAPPRLLPPPSTVPVGRPRGLIRKLLWGGVALTVGGALIALWLGLSHGPPSHDATADVVPRQLTANPIDRSLTGAAISPDGRYLAYTTPNGLFLQVVATRETQEIHIEADVTPTQVSWYPDGTGLLFIAARRAAIPALWSINAFGGRPAKIADNVARAALSPDAHYIAYIPYRDAAGQGRREVWRVNADGSDPRRLLSVGAGDSVFNLAWSPDGGRIGVGKWSSGRGGMRIETVDMEGSKRKTLLSDGALFQHWTGILPFSWCGDDQFVFARAEDPEDPLTSNLWLSAASRDGTTLTGKPARLTRWVGSNVRNLTTTADCSALTTLLVRNQADVFVASLDSNGDALGLPTQVTYDEREDTVLGWSPNGTELLIGSSRSGALRAYRKPLDEQSMNAVTAVGTMDSFQPRPITWDPTGHALLFIRHGAIERVAEDGGATTEIVHGQFNAVKCVAGIPRCIAGHVDRAEYIFTGFDALHGEPSELVRVEHREPFTSWDLSSDGHKVAVVHNDDNEILVVDLADGSKTTLQVRNWRNFEFVAWAADGRALYVNAGFSVAGTYAALLRVALDGRVTVLRDRPNEWHVYPQVSPDGARLAYSVMGFHGNAWLLEGFR